MAQKDSPAPSESGRTLRNPRRRNRVESESIKVAPRRKRSKITENTFLPRDSPSDGIEEEPQQEERHRNGNGRAVSGRSNGRMASVSMASGDVEMPVRGARNTVRRAARADGARILTQNENYSVKLLSSTPRELSREGVEFRGGISVTANLALATTHEKAYIWDYNGISGAATKSVDITFPAAHHDPLPFGAFVTSSGSTDTGLLLVSAATGKVIYHESIERVTSLGFFQERREGVEGTIAGLFSGERVIQLASADPAGFVALCSTGRAAHISLRDAQGKPKISTQFLYTSEQSSGGLFGSIKSIFGAASWKQSLSALRVRTLERGQVQVLGLMERGELRIWDLDWSGRYDFRSSIDLREQLQHELKQTLPAERHGEVDHLALLDLAVTEAAQSNKMELVSLASGPPLEATVLVRYGAAGMRSYTLVQFSLTGNDFNITRILDVHVSVSKVSTAHRERLLVPAPGHTAMVILPDSIAIISLASASLNPEAQFHETSYIEPSPFQDAVYLQADRGLSIIGGDADVSRNHTDSSGIVYVTGAGFLRITAHETLSDSTDTAAVAKAKLEQAVFYGFQDGTILDLLRPGHIKLAEADVEDAALSINNDILHSSSKFFDLPPVSVSANLQKRADATSHLASYLQKLNPHLPRKTKWTLLTSAEKIAAGAKLYAMFEAGLGATSKGRRKAALLHEVCEMVNQEHPFESLWPQSSPDDLVRTFFVTQLDHVGKLLPWAHRVLQDLQSDTPQGSPELVRLISEADDIWLGCLQTAYTHRRDNAANFGVHLKMIEHDTAPDPHDLQSVEALWTSQDDLIKTLPKFIDLTRTATKAVFEANESLEDSATIKKIARENSSLVDLMCQINLEHIALDRSKGDAKFDARADRLLEGLDRLRYEKIRALAEVGQADAAIALADKYRDMRTLTETLIAESQYLEESTYEADPVEKAALTAQMNAIIKKVNKYFEKFGQDFAEAFFGEGFAAGSGKMLSDTHEWDNHMAEWLQRNPSRAKACWINDVARVKDFKHAAKSLHQAAVDQEDMLWNKSIELSLAKLAMHAHFEDAAVDEAQVQSMDASINRDMQIVGVQQRYHEHVQPQTYHALDAEAAVEEVMRSLYKPLLAFKAWESVMRNSVTKVLSHHVLQPEQLIDLLTQGDPSPLSIVDRDIDRSETFEALQVVAALDGRSAQQLETLTQLTWKRAYLNEDWDEINSNAAKQSEEETQTMLQKTNVYRAMTHVMHAGRASGLLILKPKEVLGAGLHVDDLSAYLPSDLHPLLLEENKIMERQLEHSIAKKQLEHWTERILEAAEQAVFTVQHNGHPAGSDDDIKEEDVDAPTDLTGIEQAPGHFDNSDIEMEG